MAAFTFRGPSKSPWTLLRFLSYKIARAIGDAGAISRGRPRSADPSAAQPSEKIVEPAWVTDRRNRARKSLAIELAPMRENERVLCCRILATSPAE